MDTPEEWTPAQNEMFCRMYRFMVENQTMFTHPKAKEVPLEHWACTCHNAAWHAATMLEDDSLTVIVDADTGEELARERDGELQ